MPFFPFRLAAKLLALFCLVLGAKFCVMRACSSPLPFFDQWNGEGVYFLQPWLHAAACTGLTSSRSTSSTASC